MPRLTYLEIDAIERVLGHKLPELYRRLLFQVGYGPISVSADSGLPDDIELFDHEVKYGLTRGVDAVIYHPLAVREIYEFVFDDPDQLFHPYFPFGCQHITQEIWVIDASKEVAATIWHETVPDDWDGEEWLPYDQWLETYLKPELGKSALETVL